MELAAGKDAPNTFQKPAKKMWRLAQENTKHCPNIFLELPPKNDCRKSAILKAIYIYIYSYISINISCM